MDPSLSNPRGSIQKLSTRLGHLNANESRSLARLGGKIEFATDGGVGKEDRGNVVQS